MVFTDASNVNKKRKMLKEVLHFKIKVAQETSLMVVNLQELIIHLKTQKITLFIEQINKEDKIIINQFLKENFLPKQSFLKRMILQQEGHQQAQEMEMAEMDTTIIRPIVTISTVELRKLQSKVLKFLI